MRSFIGIILCVVLMIAIYSDGYSESTVKKGYAPVNDLKMYYEIHGKEGGVPLVLLHGGASTIETTFSALLPLLSKTRTVIAFEQQGHGRTADVDRPFSFEQSADDTAALLQYLKVEKADFYGFSNGATIALQIGIRHPQLVRKLIVASGLYKRNGVPSEFWEGMKHATLKNMPIELREAYIKVSPHPEKLQSFQDKSAKRMVEFKDIPDEQMRSIKAPTLIMIGDVDVPRPEHAVEMFRVLPNAQLAILPGTDHAKFVQRADWQIAMIEPFLDSSL